ncbi:MAG: isoaspartyl peptidase/L-asparaginase [Nitrospira defluvii]|nr:isoaspartyl peptidase/L-asparaginase [Nitrospira defluvii]
MTVAQAACVESALAEGHRLLMAGLPALSVVEEAIRLLEDSGLFNAGRGANHQLDGVRRMDASIMEGHQLRAGAVASIEGIVYPITAARLVMEKTAHVLLVGQSASRFANYFGLERAPRAKRAPGPRSPQLTPRAGLSRMLRLHQAIMQTGRIRARSLGKETVGAVALDLAGTVAAGASTGGVDVMLPGRVGDTPLIGCGVYADNEAGAVSMTGLGESIVRVAVAKEISDLLACGLSPVVSANRVLRKVVDRVRGAAGVLVLSPDGRFAIRHSTPHMVAGSIGCDGRPRVKSRFA